MKARDMISGAAFSPDSVKDLQAAFAQAWETLASSYPEAEHEAVRVRLARTLLALRSQQQLSANGLRDAAVKVLRAQLDSFVATQQHAQKRPNPGRDAST